VPDLINIPKVDESVVGGPPVLPAHDHDDDHRHHQRDEDGYPAAISSERDGD
jgi:hypothetical protein